MSRTGGDSGRIWWSVDVGLAAELSKDLIKISRTTHDPGRRRSLAQRAENAWPDPLREPPDDPDQLRNDQNFRTVFRQPRAAAEEVSPVSPRAAEVRGPPAHIQEDDQIGGVHDGPGNPFDHPGRRLGQSGFGGSALVRLRLQPSRSPDDLVEAPHRKVEGRSDTPRQGRLSAAGVSGDEDPRHGVRLSRVPVS